MGINGQGIPASDFENIFKNVILSLLFLLKKVIMKLFMSLVQTIKTWHLAKKRMVRIKASHL